jgi:hypothetical protein
MLIILYNCHSDWMPANYLPAEILKDNVCACMHASKQASRSAVQVAAARPTDKVPSNLEIPKVHQVGKHHQTRSSILAAIIPLNILLDAYLHVSCSNSRTPISSTAT